MLDDMYRNVNRRNLTDHGGGPPNPERTPLTPAEIIEKDYEKNSRLSLLDYSRRHQTPAAEASPATPADEGSAAVAADDRTAATKLQHEDAISDDRMLGGAGAGNGDMPATPTAARLARAYDEQLRRRKRLIDRMTKALRQHGPKLGGGWDEVEDLKHVNELLENATEFIESAI